jgi:hypothetical protein
MMVLSGLKEAEVFTQQKLRLPSKMYRGGIWRASGN